MTRIILTISATLLVFACVAGFKGCSEKQQKDFRIGVSVAAEAARDSAADLQGYCDAGLLKPESCEKIQPHVEKFASLADRADKFVLEHPKLDLKGRDEMLALADDLIAELGSLESDGTIQFKDEGRRRDFLLGIAIAKSAVRTARSIVKSSPVAN